MSAFVLTVVLGGPPVNVLDVWPDAWRDESAAAVSLVSNFAGRR